MRLSFRKFINIETQVYEVMGASYKEQPLSKFSDLNLIGHNLMKFTRLTGIAQPVAKPISFGEIFVGDFEYSGIYG